MNKVSKDRELLFSNIFNSSFEYLYHYGLKISRDKGLVEDCIQELFIRIWKNSVDLHAIKRIKPYLIKALRCSIFSSMRLKHYDILNQKDGQVNIEFSPEDFYIRSQDEERMAKIMIDALDKLPQKQREALYLRYFEELTLEEVADIMQVKIQSVKNNLQRGYKVLARILF